MREHVARMGRVMHTKFWSEKLKERDCLEDVDVGGTIILEWFLGK